MGNVENILSDRFHCPCLKNKSFFVAFLNEASLNRFSQTKQQFLISNEGEMHYIFIAKKIVNQISQV